MSSHEVHRVLPYPPEQLFDIAADVERYPEFLPWWIAARVRDRHGEVYDTDQVVGLGVFRQRFTSKTVLRRPERIEVTSKERRFSRFELAWAFDPLPEGSCRVSPTVDLELRSWFLQALLSRTLAGAVEDIVSAFEERAGRLSGSPAEACPQPCRDAPADGG